MMSVAAALQRADLHRSEHLHLRRPPVVHQGRLNAADRRARALAEGQQLASEFLEDPHDVKATELPESKNLSPKKVLVYNDNEDEIESAKEAQKKGMFADYRLFSDAFAVHCGFRRFVKSKDELKEERQRNEEAGFGGTRMESVLGRAEQLQSEADLSIKQLRFIVNGFREKANRAVHEETAWRVALSLQKLCRLIESAGDKDAELKQAATAAIHKAFEWLLGESLEDAISKKDDLVRLSSEEGVQRFEKSILAESLELLV